MTPHLLLCALQLACLPALFSLNLDLGYYLHLVKGQFRLLWDREPIERLLKRDDLHPEVRARLLFVQEVRAFAQQEVGLARSRNYTTFCDIGEGPVSWQLTAAPKDRLEPVRWNYPVVGRFPYRGYFDLERAKRERDRLEAEGYDTFLRRVSAYSTLGWFEDPVLSSMLRYRDEDLAELLIHELTHATVWISGNVPFNEGLATFVGETGAIRFLERRHGEGAPEVQAVLDRRADARTFTRFMHDTARELETLYARDLSYDEKLARREAVFEAAKARFDTLALKTDLYGSFPDWRLNNAVMMAYRTYHEKVDVFERVYRAVGEDLKAAVAVFKGCEGRADPEGYLRDWLEKRSK